jgi:hypothetical protein
MSEQIFKFGMRQVVYYPDANQPGTIIGRAEHANKEPTYLVRPFSSESLTEGKAFEESVLKAF